MSVKLIVTIAVSVFFVAAVCFHFMQVLTGLKVVKSKKASDEGELRKFLRNGIIGLAGDVLVYVCFIKVIFE